MTERELIIAAAEKVLGWNVVSRAAWWRHPVAGELVDCDEDGFYFAERSRSATRKFNPLESDADALMLVDAMKEKRHAAFVLGSNGCADQYTAWIIEGIWSLGRQQNEVPDVGDSHIMGCATASSRPRAITLACLRAAGVED